MKKLNLALVGFGVLAINFIFLNNFSTQTQAPSWNNFVQARQNGTEPQLPDFSYAGYHFSEAELPDISSWKVFDVTDYGAKPNDNAYDDAGIQAAINAAQNGTGPAVVFFPKGKFIVSADNDINKKIKISRSNIVLKGSGSGTGGTEIFMDKMRPNVNYFLFEFKPSSTSSSVVTTINKAVKRESFWVDVADASKLSVGQYIYINHNSKEFRDNHFGSLQLSPDWQQTMAMYEIHRIDEIQGNRIRFKNPVHANIPMVSTSFEIRTINLLSEVGVEDILFTSNWVNYPEAFSHHKDSIHDYGWNALLLNNVRDAWVRNCVFSSWSQAFFVWHSISVTAANVKMAGKQGHFSFSTKRSYGFLVKDCEDQAGQAHGLGTSYSAENTVYLRCKMKPGQSIDCHGGLPFATLIDDVDGGMFHGNGGALNAYPQHARYMVFWNFRYNASAHDYDFWVVDKRTNPTYAQPYFAGFQSGVNVTFKNHGLNEFQGQMVCPRSLFEAQLNLRLTGNQNILPSVNITSPANNSTYNEPANSIINANASDANCGGSVSKVEFFHGNTKLGEDLTSPYAFSWNNIPAGTYTLTAIATDNQGATKTSSAVVITVTGSGPPACLPAVASADDGNAAPNAVDNDLNTRWSADGDGQWIRICLNDSILANRLRIAFFKGNERTSTFDLEVSMNGTSWTKVITGAVSSGTTLSLESFSFPQQWVKFARVTGHGNSVNTWNSYTEVVLDAVTTVQNEKEPSEKRMLIYPNPADANDVIHIKNISSHSKLTITNNLGQTVWEKIVQNNSVDIPLPGWAAGLYHISIVHGKQIQSGNIFIKQE